jgi:hypothetical protein
MLTFAEKKICSCGTEGQVEAKEVTVVLSALQSRPLPKINFHWWYNMYLVKSWYTVRNKGSIEGLSAELRLEPLV